MANLSIKLNSHQIFEEGVDKQCMSKAEDTTNILQNNTESDSSVSSHDFKAQIKYKEPIKAWQIHESQIFKWLCVFTIRTSLSAVTAI